MKIEFLRNRTSKVYEFEDNDTAIEAFDSLPSVDSKIKARLIINNKIVSDKNISIHFYDKGIVTDKYSVRLSVASKINSYTVIYTKIYNTLTTEFDKVRPVRNSKKFKLDLCKSNIIINTKYIDDVTMYGLTDLFCKGVYYRAYVKKYENIRGYTFISKINKLKMLSCTGCVYCEDLHSLNINNIEFNNLQNSKIYKVVKIDNIYKLELLDI